jgi:hypothetical protein
MAYIYTSPSDSIQAYLTDYARQLIARATIGEVVYQVVGFSVGRGGYDIYDPVLVEPVDTAAQTLEDQVFPDAINYAPFAAIEQPTTTSVMYACRLPSTPAPTNADYGLGELGVWGKILVSNVPSEVNATFLFAAAHFPIRAKTYRDAWLLRAVVQF